MNYEELRAQLGARLTQLRGEIQEGVRDARDVSITDLAGEVQDSGDASVGIEQTDLRNAQLKRDLLETQAIQDALARLDAGRFGICERCSDDIELARLHAQPIARFCYRCQDHLERIGSRDGMGLPAALGLGNGGSL
jgi:DnaK suppressor protein